MGVQQAQSDAYSCICLPARGSIQTESRVRTCGFVLSASVRARRRELSASAMLYGIGAFVLIRKVKDQNLLILFVGHRRNDGGLCLECAVSPVDFQRGHCRRDGAAGQRIVEGFGRQHPRGFMRDEVSSILTTAVFFLCPEGGRAERGAGQALVSD